MPKQLNAGAITQSLQRAFGFKGRYIPMLDEVIVPVYIIADPSPASKTKLCAATSTLDTTGTIGFGLIQLLNPVGSGNLINVTSVVVLSDIKERFDIVFFGDGGFSKRNNIFFRDRRVTGKPTSLITRAPDEARLGDVVASITVDGALTQNASWDTVSGDPRQPLAVLPEGEGLVVQQNVSAGGGQMIVNFRFLEVPITELSPPGGLP